MRRVEVLQTHVRSERAAALSSAGVRKLLVANRGEIAVRVIRAAQELGVGCVAVCTAGDTSLHRHAADACVELPAGGYLDADAIVAAAVRAQCDSVHPGYGYLSESAELASKVAAAGLRFVGPSPETIALAADKIEARRCAASVGVAVARGSPGALGSAAAVRSFVAAEGLLFPVILKAANGGGGRGIRIVWADSELEEAFERCRGEAAAAFGAGGGIFVEQFIPSARHIEVQLVGDGRDVVHLFERDCSVQSAGHQKVVELAPAPGLPDAVRKRLWSDAVRIGRAVGLRSAATAEFLVPPDGDPVFLEVNARIQVEHTVTEEVTGIDIVRLQLQVAGGASLAELGVRQGDVRCRGSALQARLTASAAGAVTGLHLPSGRGVRIDTAAYAGYEVSPAFDPLLAKIVVFDAAPLSVVAARARRALGEVVVRGVPTNLGTLRAVLASEELVAGGVTTRWLQSLPAAATADSAVAGFITDAGSPAAAPADAPPTAVPEGGVVAPVHGVVVKVRVSVGDEVTAGQPVAVLTSMKMETVVPAPHSGTVTAVAVRQGQTLVQGAVVAVVAKGDVQALSRAEPTKPSRWAEAVAELQLRERLAKQHGGEDAVQRQHTQGRMTVRERVQTLVDPGSFRDVGRAAGVPHRDESGRLVSMTPPNFVLGTGKVGGRPVVVGGEDFTIQGGSPNVAGLAKSIYTEQLPGELRIPLVRLHEGGGGSVGGASDRKKKGAGPPKKEQRRPPKTYATGGQPVYTPHRFTTVADVLSQVPVASAALGSVAGLPASRLVASHFCVMSKSTAQVITGGPKVVERALGYSVTKQQLGGWEVHRSSGVVDNFAEDEADAISQIKQFLSYLPSNVYQLPPVHPSGDDPHRTEESLLDFMPENRRQTYDVRRLLRLVFDRDPSGASSVFEWGTTDYGRTQVCALARLSGVPVGVFANDCRFFGGAMTADAAQKVRRFIEMCETFHLPIIAFVDEPGFMVGVEAEKAGTIRYGTQVVLAAAQCKLPWCSVQIRKSYGVAAAAHFANKGHVMLWPSAEAGALPVESGVAILFRRELASARKSGGAEAEERLRQQIEDQYTRALTPWPRLDAFGVHEIIDPRETRPRLCEWLELNKHRLDALLGPPSFPFR